MAWIKTVKNVAASNVLVLSKCDWCKKYNITQVDMSEMDSMTKTNVVVRKVDL